MKGDEKINETTRVFVFAEFQKSREHVVLVHTRKILSDVIFISSEKYKCDIIEFNL